MAAQRRRRPRAALRRRLRARPPTPSQGTRPVYVAETAETARDALEAFDADWGRQYHSIAQAWCRAWQEVIPFFAFSPEIRRVIYTTNATENLNRVIRKAIKTWGSFPCEDAAEKLIYLAIRGHEKTARTV